MFLNPVAGFLQTANALLLKWSGCRSERLDKADSDVNGPAKDCPRLKSNGCTVAKSGCCYRQN